MLTIVLIGLAALSPLQSAHAERSEANPMRKIISMLQDMTKELEAEAEAEKEIFDKAACVCEGGEGSLKKVIDDSTAAIEEYTSKIGAGEAEKAQLTQEIADHKASAAAAEEDLSHATMLRDKEHKKFVEEDKDTKFNIASLGKAIPAIEKGMGGAAFMQLSGSSRFRRFVEVTKFMSSDDRSTVLSFLNQGMDDEDSSAEQAPQSGQILGILKSMKDEMEADLKELQDQEASDFNSFNDLKAAKTEEISVNKKSVITKDKRVGAVLLTLSEDTHALEDSQKELANAQTFLANMQEQCATMEKDRAMREKMRTAEIAAISEAVKILNDDDALEVFKKSLPSAALVQQPAQTYDALLQLNTMVHSTKAIARKHVPSLMLLATGSKLREEPQSGAAWAANEEAKAQKSGSAAEKLVTHMVDGMVAVLHDDDVEDEHKKDWCANETMIGHNIETEKQALLASTASEMAEQEDTIATLTQEIKDLTAKIAETDKLVHESSEDRKSSHQEFVNSFATSATAIRLIDKAILRLEKFYSPEKIAAKEAAVKEAALKKAGLSLLHKDSAPVKNAYVTKKMENALLPGGFDSFLQIKDQSTRAESATSFRSAIQNGVDPIELPSTPKTYEKKESGGVISLMNDFKTDLKTDMTESETEEKFAAKEYVRIMADAQKSRAGDVESLNQKKSTKASVTEKLVSNKQLHETTDEEIHNLQLYLVQIHAECDFLMRNFEARHEGRVESETGLESAETIVTAETPPSHKMIESGYEEEHTAQDVDEHYPGTAH